MNRDAIVEALYQKLVATDQFVTTGRRLRLWDDLQPTEKPALFMLQRGDDYHRPDTAPARVTMNVDLFVYTATPQGKGYIPATQMNDLMDAIDAALAPAPYETVQTLDGLVTWCRIEGKTLLDTGEIDGQGLAVIPVKILVPN